VILPTENDRRKRESVITISYLSLSSDLKPSRNPNHIP
jgi:hypothetical protein